MRRLNPNSLFRGALWWVVVALVAEGWGLSRGWWGVQRGLAALEQKKQERERLGRQSPALSLENEQAIGRDLAGAEKILLSLQAGGRGADPQIFTGPVPARAVDAYVDLAAFVERTRARAAHAQVVIRPDEHFGFSAYANQGPAAAQEPAVFRQRVVVEYLVERLFEARPRALLGVQREHPLTVARRSSRNPPGPAGRDGARPEREGAAPGDFFESAEGTMLRVPGQLDGQAFRFEFTGQTRALRDFLHSLAAGTLPVIVRRVETEPPGGSETGTIAALPVAAGAPGTQNVSRFTVVVEFVEPAAAPGKSSP